MTDEQTLLTWAEFVLNSKMTRFKKTHTPIYEFTPCCYCCHTAQTENFSPGLSPIPLAVNRTKYIWYLLPATVLSSVTAVTLTWIHIFVPSRRQEPLQAKLRLHSCGFEGQVITGPTPKFKSILLKFLSYIFPFLILSRGNHLVQSLTKSPKIYSDYGTPRSFLAPRPSQQFWG